MPELADGVVVLTPLETTDAEAHLAGEDNEQARRFGWHPQRATLVTVRTAIARWREQWAAGGPTRAFAVRLATTRELVGGCEVRLQADGTAHLSYWTFPAHRRRGLATRALRLVSEYASTTLGVWRLDLHIEPDNVASRRVAQQAGFSEAGTVQDSPGVDARQRLMMRYLLCSAAQPLSSCA